MDKKDKITTGKMTTMPGKSIRISAFFLTSMIIVAVLAITVTGTFWVYREYEKFVQNSEKLRNEFLERQKAIISNEIDKVFDYIEYRRSRADERLRSNLRERVEQAYTIAMHIHEKYSGQRPRAEIERMIKETLRPIRFNNGRGYYFIVTMDGVEKLYPVAPQYEDQNLLDLQDEKGNYVIRDEIRIVRSQGEGFVTDYWRKPNAADAMIYPKLTFVKYFKPFNWYMGTGEYLDDVDLDLQDEIIERVVNVRFGHEGYIFINTYSGIPIITDGRRVTNPKSLWDLTDPNGVKVMQEERRAVENPQGDFIYYTWRKLSSNEPAPKVSFIRGIPDWKWMIGAGVYLDEVEKVIEEKKQALWSDLQGEIVKTLLVIVLIGIFIAFLVHHFSKRLKRSIEVFSSFLENAATASITIDESQLHFLEFKRLAHTANTMIENRIKAENEKELLQEQLLRARRMEALGLLTGGVAHNLNNILSGIVSYPEMVLMKLPPDSNLRRPLEVIHNAGLRAAAVVNDLLSASQGAQGEADVININDSVEVYLASSDHKTIAEHNPDIRLDITLAPDLLTVRCSRVLLMKSLRNLVANAVESMNGKGRLLITTENRVLQDAIVGYEEIPAGAYVVLRCEDNGPGIEESDQARIFEPFFTRKVLGRSGSGLGLTIVWHMVHDAGGYIDLKSSSSGTAFELYFVAERGEVRTVGETASLDALMGQGQTILVVDDEPHQREIACEMLKNLGYHAEAVKSGEEAVKWLSERPADLILLDMVLGEGPVMNGRQAYEEVLKIRPEQKAIIVTGFAETEDVKATLALGAGSMVRKPYELKTIAAAIHRELQRP